MTTSLCRLVGGVSVLVLATFGDAAFAQQPLSMTITSGNLLKSETVPTATEAKRTLRQTPGGVALVTRDDIENRYIQNFQDTLSLVPGVYAQKRYGEEVRLSIRGSGLSRGFHLRGITLLQDGIPFNLADGGADFQEADPLALDYIEVYKGANALAYGGNSLGGAINLVSPTGHTAPGNQLRLEAGSENTTRANIRTGHVFGNQDAFLSLTTTASSGFRQNSDQSNVKLNTNYGLRINDRTETRFFLSGNIIEQKLPGTLSRSNALNFPNRAAVASVSGNQKRDIRSLRLANKTAYRLSDKATLEGGVYLNMKDLFHPIFAVVDQESMDYGGFGTLKGKSTLGSHNNVWRLGLTAQAGAVDALLFSNVRGSRGALIGDADQNAATYNVFAENSLYVTPTLALVTGAQLTWASRSVFDNINPTDSDERTYRAFNPKLGLLYEPVAGNQFYANISKSNEAPTFSELTQAGTVGFIPLNAQQAWTAEAGTRGTSGRYSWDISLYRAWVEDEMLQFTTNSSIPAATFNANRTIHQGLEAGFNIALSPQVTWQNAWTYSDFRFQGDPQYGDNRLAGVPPHVYRTVLRYDNPQGWYVAPNLEWVPIGADVDFANTLDAPGYAVLGLEAGYDLTPNISLFVDARNLTDENYISNFSTITRATPANTNVFYPGEGVSAFAGVVVRF